MAENEAPSAPTEETAAAVEKLLKESTEALEALKSLRKEIQGSEVRKDEFDAEGEKKEEALKLLGQEARVETTGPLPPPKPELLEHIRAETLKVQHQKLRKRGGR